MVHLFILNYPLEYAKRFVTWFQGEQKCRSISWINNWAVQIHCNPRVPDGVNKLVSKGSMKRDHRGLQKVYVIWHSFCVLGASFARTFEYQQLLFPRLWSF